jgi:hypothetical protein
MAKWLDSILYKYEDMIITLISIILLFGDLSDIYLIQNKLFYAISY